jgi:hypothetical protein
MTLEINEISVQISVSSQSASSGLAAGPTSAPLPMPSEEQLDQIVNRCVRDVLRHLRMRERR